MAIEAKIMSQENNSSSNNKDDDQLHDEEAHDHDMVMPGFRFHPTEEELIEFYLRRKVEGKRFNVELITFLDLYRYDPWELPALAAIGEKEWFFYVPRDRKYRNGDRPNRVTTSGYWKATGADRMIRTENFRSIGLKKTLVFYSGKAPKGLRTSWIMNEYRLPQHETERLQKAEISLCRVYKRAGVEDHPSLPRSLPTRSSASSSRATSSSSSSAKKSAQETLITSTTSFLDHQSLQSFAANPQQLEEKLETSGSSSTDIGTMSLGPGPISKHNNNINNNFISLGPMSTTTVLSVGAAPIPNSVSSTTDCPAGIFAGPSFVPGVSAATTLDDLHRLVNFQQQYQNNNNIHPNQQPMIPGAPTSSQIFSSLLQPAQQVVQHESTLGLNMMIPAGPSLQAAFTDRLWDWNSINEASKDFNSNPFK